MLRNNYYSFSLYDKIPIETRDIRTKIAPNIVTLLPENSLPNSKPRPSPAIIPILKPFLSISFLTPNFKII